MNAAFSALSNLVAAQSSVVVAAIFAAMAVAAVAAVAWPVLRAREKTPPARAVLTAAVGLFVVGLAGGAYLMLGSPGLAVRALAAPGAGDVPGLIADLSRRMRDRPSDLTGWTLLGRGYLTLNDPAQAAIAFRQASMLAAAGQKPELLSSYGEALTLAAGTVTPEAEAAFQEALAGSPNDFAARYYLGGAYADRHEVARARALWASLLADAPPNAPWRGDVTDRLAALAKQSGTAPNINAMVEGLATRLKTRPDDLSGWERLVRAYAVLGKRTDARRALTNARAAFAGNPEKLAALETEARSLGLER
ncbi:MAG TPA: tetratricopeptide repeat protein [Rhizomicrobium sp.]|jgi:cytochrome c-type biogenesis protein CcmH